MTAISAPITAPLGHFDSDDDARRFACMSREALGAKELEIPMLRHELSILRREPNRPRFEPANRLLLAALSQMLPRRSWNAFSVRLETLLSWHRRLVGRRWTYHHPPPREQVMVLNFKPPQSAERLRTPVSPREVVRCP
jgi:hypothetical protein